LHKAREVPRKTTRQKKRDESPPSFEQALERLEHIAGELESGVLSLEEMIDMAEEGLKLSQLCEKQLAEAEGKIEQLVERMGKVDLQPLDVPTDEDQED
jgi:exodeoxyribonuclease VII small subunit